MAPASSRGRAPGTRDDFVVCEIEVHAPAGSGRHVELVPGRPVVFTIRLVYSGLSRHMCEPPVIEETA